MKTLKPFQIEAVRFLLARKNVLLADIMGSGKTLSTIGALNVLLPRKVLIVCPAAIKDQWRRAIEEESIFWAGNIQIAQGRDCRISGDVVIINYDLLTCPDILFQLTDRRWEVGIYDEVHYCKSLDAKRTKAVFGKSGLVHSCVRNLMLTGTPVLNRPVELYPLLKVLAPDVLEKENTYQKFGIKFCKGWFDGRELNVQGSSNEEELGRRLRNTGFMLRRTEKEIALQLPKKRFQIYMMDAEEKDLRLMESIERKEFKKRRFPDETPIATIRRELAVKKTDKAIKTIRDIVEQVEKIVIFAYHKEVVDLLMKYFHGEAVKIDGSCSQNQRQVALKKFREHKEVKVLVGQITAAGQGLDGMQDVCNHVLFVELSWTPAELTQAIARVHRMGQERSVLIQFIVYGKSVEEHMLRTVLDKQETINKIMKGDTV